MLTEGSIFSGPWYRWKERKTMAEVKRHETWPVRSSEGILRIRQVARQWAMELGFGLVDQTKIVTATSELARNLVDFGGGGTVRIEALNEGERRGLRLIFEDKGPGIPDLEVAMKDGYSTRGGLGLGLSGSKRLMNEFEIISRAGEGTRVTITKWK
jgi:serine/threonine-protein kinase RsbT